MNSNAPAYAMSMLNQYNETGKTLFVSTDIGLDQSAFDYLESIGVIEDKHDVIGTIEFRPAIASAFLKMP